MFIFDLFVRAFNYSKNRTVIFHAEFQMVINLGIAMASIWLKARKKKERYIYMYTKILLFTSRFRTKSFHINLGTFQVSVIADGIFVSIKPTNGRDTHSRKKNNLSLHKIQRGVSAYIVYYFVSHSVISFSRMSELWQLETLCSPCHARPA